MESLHRLTCIVAVVLAGFILVMPAQGHDAAPSAAGFVAGIQGKGYILRNKDKIMISGMDLLFRGDLVQLAEGAKARISICGARGYEIRGSAIFTIGGSGITFKKGKSSKTYAVDRKACAAALEVFLKNEKKIPEMVTGERKGTLILRFRKKGERRGVYVVRGKKQAPRIELYSEKLLPQKPLILWSPVKGRASYRVVIKDGGETLWSSAVEKNSCRYPESAPAMAEGRDYDILIEAVGAQGEVLAGVSGTISLFGAADRESLRKDEASIKEMTAETSPDRHILLGKLYEAHGQIADALASYEKALSLDSGNAGLKERVALLKNMME
ncbi:MAG: tetratricopeptide repeat protein [Spirochaetes bacterium]|nr:tetratricopeptide repeat protein [Spirochaetota bacterium]